jgi:hypothetical protein
VDGIHPNLYGQATIAKIINKNIIHWYDRKKLLEISSSFFIGSMFLPSGLEVLGFGAKDAG